MGLESRFSAPGKWTEFKLIFNYAMIFQSISFVSNFRNWTKLQLKFMTSSLSVICI